MSDPDQENDAVQKTDEQLKANQARQQAETLETLRNTINDATKAIENQIKALDPHSSVDISGMFELQLRMNRLSQLSEMQANVLSALNQSMLNTSRSIKD